MSVVDIAQLPEEPHLLLDTHVWLALASGNLDRIEPELPAIVEAAARAKRLYASAASVWELSIKVQQGLLHIGNPYTWFSNQNRPPGVTIYHIVPEIAIDVTCLPKWVHPDTGEQYHDPIDRFIVATARRFNCALVTADPIMLSYARAGHINAVNAAVPENITATITS